MKKIIGTVALAAGLFGAAACTPEPAPEPTPAPETQSPSPEPEASQEPTQSPQEPATDTDSAGPAEVDVPISNFDGASTYVEPFQVYVNEAYIDDDGYITDGMGFSDVAPAGMEYHIFNIQITNDGTYPASFDTYGTRGTDTQGRSFTNDEEAEFTVADDYLWEELNPGATVETDIIFLLPEGVQLASVDVNGYGELVPFDE